MSLQGWPVELDRSLPFVKMIFAVINNEASLQEAANLLLGCEERHGVHIWNELDDRSTLGAGLFLRRHPEKQMPLKLIQDLLLNRDLFEQEFVYSPGDDFEISALFPFLSETQLILQGMDFTNGHFIQYANGAIAAYTQRAWGNVLAEWANSVDWGPHFHDDGQKMPWIYIDFYSSLSDQVIKDYSIWCQTVSQVIHHKTTLVVSAES